MYAKIDDFLEKRYSDFWDLIHLVNFNIVPGSKGLTVLLPNKDLMKELKALYDNKGLKEWPKEVEFLKSTYHVEDDQLGPSLVSWIIKSLFLTQYYPDGPSFEVGAVVNKLFKTYKLKSQKRDKVELDIGTLTLDTEFKQLKNTGPHENPLLAAWHFEGKPNILTPAFEKPERHKVVGGKASRSESGARNAGLKIGLYIWGKIAEGKKHNKDFELSYIVSLINFLKSKGDMTYKSVISWDPLVSIALLLQPGCCTPFVPENLLVEWVSESFFSIEVRAKEKYIAICEEACNDNLELEAKKTRTIDLLSGERACVDQILQVYANTLADFPGYKSLQHKVNHDVLRWWCESPDHPQASSENMQRVVQKMNNIDTRFGEHSLNPNTSFTSGDDYRWFIKSHYFLHHIRLETPRIKLMELTSPIFNISVEKIADLQRRLA